MPLKTILTREDVDEEDEDEEEDEPDDDDDEDELDDPEEEEGSAGTFRYWEVMSSPSLLLILDE